MSLRKGSSAPTAEGSNPPYGSGTSPRPTGPPTRVEPTYRGGGVQGRHVSRRRRRGRESSTGRLAHPPHSMRVVEACSAAVARGAVFVRPHCRPHITEVHSAAASAQSPSAALNRYDGTTSFHHITYVASYTAVWVRGRLRQTTPQATANYAASYALAPFRQDRAWLCRTEDAHEQGNPGMRSPSPAMP